MRYIVAFLLLFCFGRSAHGLAGVSAIKYATVKDTALTISNTVNGSISSTPIASFRIVFGVKDTIEKAWNGQIVLKPGQRLSIEADCFRNHQYEAKGWSAQGIITIKLGDPSLPNDYLKDSLQWVCSTRKSPMHGPTTEWHDHGQLNNLHSHQVLKPIVQQPSIIVNLYSSALNESITVNTVRGNFTFTPSQVIRQQEQDFVDGNIRVAVVPQVTTVTGERAGQQDFPSIAIARSSGQVWTCWQEYDNHNADQVLVSIKTGNGGSKVSVVAQNVDAFHTALAEDINNRMWAIWAMQVNGRWDIYGKYSSDGSTWSELNKLTDTRSDKNIFHHVVTDSNGKMWLVWQATNNHFSQIYAKSFDGKVWSADVKVSTGAAAKGDNWQPVIAAGAGGQVAVAWDGYASGSYDVYVRRYNGNSWDDVKTIAGTSRFEAHASIAFDLNNRLWITWDESREDWGKDTGFLVIRKGTQLHESRYIKIVCLDGDRLYTPAEDVSEVLKQREFWELPHLTIDKNGNPVLLVRHQVMREPDTPLEGPIDLALWEIYQVQYDGAQWSKPMYLPHSSGRNDMMPSSAMSANGNMFAVWATDMRDTRTFQPHQLRIELGEFGYKATSPSTKLVPYVPAMANPFKEFDQGEAAQVARIRAYKIKNNGKTYSIYRGDLHRHTDISVDGNNDGSLLDAYRYSRDVASLDFLGVADHTDDIWEKYAWYRSQKVADLFQLNGYFTAFYGYERSVEYPNGHRNIFFAKRNSADILPIGSFEARGYVGNEILYQYLHRFNGFTIPHTTGRTSGTDWRDNDPDVETLVELYQGSRDVYEYPGSPRPFQLYTLPDSTQPVPRASSAPSSPSFRPLGFSWNALAKGYKLGFIASSDHISTHVSYACLIAEELTPECLFNAVKARRAYAATDNIILDIKYKGSGGEHLMGDIFESASPVKITANIFGTNTIQQVDIIKDNQIVKTYKPLKDTFKLTYTDTAASNTKQSYFYVRVIQKNGEMAWGSPAWVSYTK